MIIPVLLYHRIAEVEKNTTLCVPPADFQQQMEYLYNQGFKTISPEDLYLHLKKDRELPEKPILLTFDDGYADFYKSALPVLLKYNFKATVFIVADLVGNINLWDTKGGWSEIKLLTWDQIKEMAKQGISIGSHGLNHLPLTKVRSLNKLISQIRNSKIKIENQINQPVLAFSYPYGKSNKFIRWLVKLSGYNSAFSTLKGVNRKDSDLFSLRRIEINSQTAPLDNFIKVIESILPNLNILQVISCPSWGGQEMQVMCIARKLKERGHKVVVACRRSSPVELNAKESGIPVAPLRVRGSFDIKAIFHLTRYIRRFNIDIVHGHAARDYWVCILAAKLTGRKVFITRHLLTQIHKPTSLILNWADKIIAVSNATKQILLQDGTIDYNRVSVIHNGIDLQQYNPDIDPDKIRKELNLNHQDPLIGCIGRMGCKGQREILYALKNVISEFPRIRCLFVSEFSDPEPLYEDLNKLGLLGHVIFKGFRNDVPHIISSMDVLINFPTWEALGMIIIEAMACAKPVIGSDVGGIPEILKDRVNGILVPPGDTEKLSQAIIYLLKNKQDALNIGKSGRDLVEKNFNLEDTIEKKEKLYYKFL